MAASRSRAPPLTSVLGPTRTTQLAAETLGVPLDPVTAKLGDSALPDARVEGGSFTTSSVGSAIHAACRSGQEEVLRLAQKAAGSPLTGAELDDIVFADGGIRRKDGAEVSLAEAMPTGKVNRIEKQANAEPNESSQYAHFTHSAIFAEVRIDEQLGSSASPAWSTRSQPAAFSIPRPPAGNSRRRRWRNRHGCCTRRR